MKDNTHNQFVLSEEEKRHMKDVVQEYMAMTPLRLHTPIAKAHTPALFSWFSFNTRPLVGSMLVLTFALSGVSYAAEGALPGDSLYSIKVHVNEEARLLFTFGDEAVAKWETRRAERRLEEAVVLARKSKDIPEAVFASLAVDIDIFASRASEKIAKLRVERPEVAEKIGQLFEQSLIKGSEELIAIQTELIEEGATLALNQAVDEQPLVSEGASDVSRKASLAVSTSIGTEMAVMALPVTPLSPVIDTVQSRIAGIPNTVRSTAPAEESAISITHIRMAGKHAFSGSMSIATCEELSAVASAQEGTVSLALTTIKKEGECAEETIVESFEAVVASDIPLTLKEVTKNGIAIDFTILDTEEPTTSNDLEVAPSTAVDDLLPL